MSWFFFYVYKREDVEWIILDLILLLYIYKCIYVLQDEYLNFKGNQDRFGGRKGDKGLFLIIYFLDIIGEI